MKHHITHRVVTAMLCAAAVVTAGCGPDGTGADPKGTAPAAGSKHPFDTMTPEQINDEAGKAFRSAASVRLTGKASEGGRQVEVDLAVDVRGSCNGTVGTSAGSLRLIKKGSLVHVKAKEDFWRATFSRGMTAEQAAKMVALFKGRWIKPPRTLSETLGGLCDGLGARIEALSSESGTNLVREADSTVGGRPSAVLTERTGSQTTTIHIAKKGKPYLLRGTVTGDAPVDLVFSDHGKPVDTTPPPPDQVLDPTTIRPIPRRPSPSGAHPGAAPSADGQGTRSG
ncbi:hypothetical protein [Streptomyces sp. NPDC046887]|uniref:hypothetical protein n=1 Tax=Streptomyces sp. NPDC046887 TaxID=3155472 RepID=UPI0033C34196